MVDLPLEAARVALAAADLEVSEIAFVFGDTTTPIETIPALAA
jgi:3-oxoacyl-[acyl-carrier-protein] synthase III